MCVFEKNAVFRERVDVRGRDRIVAVASHPVAHVVDIDPENVGLVLCRMGDGQKETDSEKSEKKTHQKRSHDPRPDATQQGWVENLRELVR